MINKIEIDLMWYVLQLMDNFKDNGCLYKIASLNESGKLEIDFIIGSKNDDRDVVDVDLTMLSSQEQTEQLSNMINNCGHYIGKYKPRTGKNEKVNFNLLVPSKIDAKKEVTVLATGYFCLNNNNYLHQTIIKDLIFNLSHKVKQDLYRVNEMLVECNKSEQRLLSEQELNKLELVQKQLKSGDMDFYSYTNSLAKRTIQYKQARKYTKK